MRKFLALALALVLVFVATGVVAIANSNQSTTPTDIERASMKDGKVYLPEVAEPSDVNPIHVGEGLQ